MSFSASTARRPSQQNELKRTVCFRVASKYGAAARIAALDRWRYPAELAGPLITLALFVFVFSRIWIAAFAQRVEIAGYTRIECTWYFAFAEICLFAAGGAFNELSRDIKNGQIAYTLARPYDLIGYAWAQRLGIGLSLLPVYVVVGYIIASFAAGPWVPDSAARFLGLILSIALSISLQFLLQAAMAMTAFWFEENSAFLWIFSKITLVAGTLMPLEFLPQAWQHVLFWTPFPWLVWAPARIAVAPDMGLRTVATLLCGQLLWVAIALLLAQYIFRLAVRQTTVHGG
jgi:ABC-2 type transport system permease protein